MCRTGVEVRRAFLRSIQEERLGGNPGSSSQVCSCALPKRRLGYWPITGYCLMCLCTADREVGEIGGLFHPLKEEGSRQSAIKTMPTCQESICLQTDPLYFLQNRAVCETSFVCTGSLPLQSFLFVSDEEFLDFEFERTHHSCPAISSGWSKHKTIPQPYCYKE
jgi:hypothetical protein